MECLVKEGRSSKCFFTAMGIGDDPGMQTLERFIAQTPVLAEVNGNTIRNTVFQATDAAKVHEFFRKVTMSVTARSRSQDPNTIPRSTEADSPGEDGGYW